MFFVMTAVTGFLHAYSPHVTFIAATLCMAAGACMAYVNLKNPHGPFYLYTSVLMIISIWTGWIAGMSIDARFMSQYWAPILRPALNGVSPMSPAAAVADAGILHFAPSARLDFQRVLGRKNQEDGEVYCVAPILHDDEKTEANMWAAGVGCCKHDSSFHCDDAGVPGASTGLVLYDPTWQVQQFRIAAVQAAAFYGLKLPRRPVFVRWVKSVDAARSLSFIRAIVLLLVWLCLYFLALLVLANFLHFYTVSEVVRSATLQEASRQMKRFVPNYGGTADPREAA